MQGKRGVIDLLDADPDLRLGLLAQYDGGQASSRQELLHERLAAGYGPSRVPLRRLWLRPAPHDPRQEHPSPPAVETTTRGRSLLFLTAALELASSVGPHAPVYLPENGYIALNVPLTRARAGSASTRTTHPHFLGLFVDAAAAIGVTNPLINPYAFATKGEMLRDSRNPGLLRELAPITVSCSHPEAARMQERAQGNCGYCFPCLIRRASLAVPGWDDEEVSVGRAVRRQTRRSDRGTPRSRPARRRQRRLRRPPRLGPAPQRFVANGNPPRVPLGVATRKRRAAVMAAGRRARLPGRHRGAASVTRLLDTHCHLDAYPDPRSVLAQARNAAVDVVAVSETPEAYTRLRTRLGGAAGVIVALGLHPASAAAAAPGQLERFLRMLPGAAWIGEVGLDLRPGLDRREKTVQRLPVRA